LLFLVGTMMSLTPTLLDPFEVAGGVRPRPRLPSFMDAQASSQATEWFDRATLPMFDLDDGFLVEESNEVPPWTPEPVDRRWRARGWTNDD
jgi:hypothetical protein